MGKSRLYVSLSYSHSLSLSQSHGGGGGSLELPLQRTLELPPHCGLEICDGGDGLLFPFAALCSKKILVQPRAPSSTAQDQATTSTPSSMAQDLVTACSLPMSVDVRDQASMTFFPSAVVMS
jgi:hypothetical protein